MRQHHSIPTLGLLSLSLAYFSGCAAIVPMPLHNVYSGDYLVDSVSRAPLHWSSPSAEFRVILPSAPEERRDEIKRGIDIAFKQFNRNPSNLTFTYIMADDSEPYGLYNGQNEIYIGEAPNDRGPAIIANYVDGTIGECDVLLDISNGRPAEAIAEYLLHELGHCAGLGHQSNVMSAMGSFSHRYQEGNSRLPYLGAVESTALGRLYGYDATKSSLIVSNVKWDGNTSPASSGNVEYSGLINLGLALMNDPGYACHTDTEIFDVTGTPFPIDQVVSFYPAYYPAYCVPQSGIECDAEFTFENLCEPTASFPVQARYFLIDRRNNPLQTRLLKTETIDLGDSTIPHTRKTRLSLPADFCGRYYLGVTADPIDAVTEVLAKTAQTPSTSAYMSLQFGPR